MEVRCGLVDPSRVGSSKKTISVDTSSSSEDSSGSEERSCSEGSGSSDEEESSDGSSSSSSREDGDEQKGKAARDPAVPAGIPARGPAVLYRCKVFHGAGSTFLVLSCPNVAYVAAVRNHAIVRGARGNER